MPRQPSVLVICQHELLGEGLVARLHALGVPAETVAASDVAGLRDALRGAPEVVVVESSSATLLSRVRRLSPGSRVVDVTTSVGRGCPAETLRFEAILDALADVPDVPHQDVS